MRAMTAGLLVVTLAARTVLGAEKQAQARNPLVGIVHIAENGAEAGAE